MAAETRPEGGHPPYTIRHGIIEGRLQHKIDGWAADISEFAQDGGAVPNIVLLQIKFLAKCQQYIAPARVEDPAFDLVPPNAGRSERLSQQTCGFLPRHPRHLWQQDIPKHSILVAEAKNIALLWRETGGRIFPLDPTPAGRRLVGKDGRTRTVPKQTGTD